MPAEPLVLVASASLKPGEVSELRKLAQSGARIVAWQHPSIVQERFRSPDVAGYLTGQGISSTPLEAALGESAGAEIDDAVIAWLKEFGRKPLGPAGSFRDQFRHQGLALWWWAELFLYHDTPLRLFVRDIEALSRLIDQERPSRLFIFGTARVLAAAARRRLTHVELRGRFNSLPSNFLRTSIRFKIAQLKMLGTGLKNVFARKRKQAEASSSGRRILFLTHASMWRQRENEETGATELVDMYFDQLPLRLAAGGDAVGMVAFGPTVPFKQRGPTGVLKEILELDDSAGHPYTPARNYTTLGMALRLIPASLRCWCMWRAFRAQPDLDRALSHHGVPLGALALPSFRDTMLLQLPWAIRSFHEVEAALAWERPDVLVLYAEYSGLGRAAIAAAARVGVISFAVQHGILYPRLYGAEHSAEEVGPAADGRDCVPIPTRTAVFGSMAKDILMQRGHYRAEQLVVTGSPKFDALVSAGKRFDRRATRRRLGVDEGTNLLVLASRFSAVGPVFTELVRAVEDTPGVCLLVKPHQAELVAPYEEVVKQERARAVRFSSAKENLLEFLFASDGLVTVDSFASSESLVLGKPVLVVNLPSNLSALVRRGVALGAAHGESIKEALQKLLFDEAFAEVLETRRRAYIMEFAFGADGRSTERILEAIRRLAGEKQERAVRE